jgi:predicted TIM-barrel fold metal-dependent hydrolase
MIVDFQTHYTPPELQKGDPTRMTVQLDENGNPNYLLNPLLTDVGAFMRMMDRTGIDACVLSSGPGFDQPDVGKCKLINDRLREIELAHPGRFIGLAQPPGPGRGTTSDVPDCLRRNTHARSEIPPCHPIRLRRPCLRRAAQGARSDR